MLYSVQLKNMYNRLNSSLKLRYCTWSFLSTVVLQPNYHYKNSSSGCWNWHTEIMREQMEHQGLHRLETGLSWKVLEKPSNTLKSPWIVPFTGGFNTVLGDLIQYKTVVPLFGAAYAAQNKSSTILYKFSKTNIFSDGLRSRILSCKSLFILSFQSLKTVGKSSRRPWKVIEFYTTLPVWTLNTITVVIRLRMIALYMCMCVNIDENFMHAQNICHICFKISYLYFD